MKHSPIWLIFAVSAFLLSGCTALEDKAVPTETIDSLFETAMTSKDAVPAADDAAWERYRRLSNQVRALDQAFINAELAEQGLQQPRLPPHANRFGFDPNQPVDFYQTPEGQRIADIVLSFQTPSGGWSKRTDMAVHPRQPGEAFGVERSYIPTFDNGATSTQMWLLTRAFQATGDTRYRDAVLRGLKLILLAQYPNGGWPQNFPLTGGYHDDLTYNDAVTSNLIQLLHAASTAQQGLDFVPQALRRHAAQSRDRALDNIVATQVVTNGTPTIWGAQHDPRTGLPSAARAFEPVALATQESAELVLFLMTITEPDDNLKKAINAAVAWFESNRILGYEWLPAVPGESRLQAKDGAKPLWSRFVELGTNRPVFGDRDGRVYYNVDEISWERQAGYAWYTRAPQKVLDAYPAWRAKHS